MYTHHSIRFSEIPIYYFSEHQSKENLKWRQFNTEIADSESLNMDINQNQEIVNRESTA
jgi:hypothetical protein